MITIKNSDIEKIREHGEKDHPYECCGLLLGSFDPKGVKVLSEVYPISNAWEESTKRNRFLITPQELLAGEKYARSKKLDVIGFYHSHPDHPAKPSQFDLDHAWPTYSYVIVSVYDRKAVDFLSWEMDPERTHFNPEEILKGA